MANTTTFKSIVPQSFSYHQSKLWEGLDYPLFRINLDVIIKLIGDTKAEMVKRFGSYSSRQGVGGEVDSIDFILQRLAQWDREKNIVDKRELYVYLEALKSHLNLLFVVFNEMDAE